MPKNAYAKTLTQNGKAREHIVKLWTAQLCLDVMADVLNDPAVMGRDALGAKRLQRVADAFNRQFPEFLRALSKDPEADYIRAKVDEQQRRIFGPEAIPWAERYTYWTEDKYL